MAFESSMFTMSAMRAPLSSVDAPSMADSLPNINFGFDDLRTRMAHFTAKFDDFIEQGRKRVLEERNQFLLNVAELQEDQKMKKKDIEILSLKSTTHAQTLQKEQQETAEMNTAISDITSQRESRAAHKDRLRQQIEETKKLIAQRREAQQAHAKYLDSQERFNGPELDFWQDYLCLRIEGAGKDDQLKFIYSHLDERNWEREGSIELSLLKRDYEVFHCRPRLDPKKVERVLDRLNETRDLGLFLKGVRELFVEVMKTS